MKAKLTSAAVMARTILLGNICWLVGFADSFRYKNRSWSIKRRLSGRFFIGAGIEDILGVAVHLPGKIARHFIRGALEAAIAQINHTEDIDEPDEAFQEGKLQLDYGRKNLKGSPDLAIEILKKIDGAAVFGR